MNKLIFSNKLYHFIKRYTYLLYLLPSKCQHRFERPFNHGSRKLEDCNSINCKHPTRPKGQRLARFSIFHKTFLLMF